MMSHDDYEQDMDDYNDMGNHIDTDYDHDMGDFDHDNDASCMEDMAHHRYYDHDYDASCMEDMADHRYYEHDMVDHHYYDHDVELYTDYTSTSIIDGAEHHTNYDNFDSMSTIDMNHCYNYDTANLDDMMEPYYTDYSDSFFAMQEEDRKSTRLNSSHRSLSRMPSSA